MTSTLKTCKRCNEALPRSEFYPHSAMADGLLGFCKDCTKRRIARHRESNIDRIRIYDNQRARLPHRTKARVEYAEEYREKNPDKRRAHGVVSRALRAGKLERKPCQVCGAPMTHAHHHDYSKPLDVVWLCPAHHRQIHTGQILVLT